MTVMAKLRRKIVGKRPPRCDRKISTPDFLTSPDGGVIQLPVLSSLGQRAHSINYAAANLLERLALGRLVQTSGAMRIFEIGTFRGVTAVSMAQNAPAGATIWTLDLPPDMTAKDVAHTVYASANRSGFHRMVEQGAEREVGAAIKDYRGAATIEQLHGDSMTFDFSAYAPIDLFFVDGCHDYEHARRDTEAALSCTRPGGLIVWHDYTWSTVERAANELCDGITWIAGTSLAFHERPAA